MLRRSNRKRRIVSYAEAVVSGEDDEEELRPAKKARTSSTEKSGRGRQAEKGFNFLELPGEIRNKIYEYLVCQSDGNVNIGSAWFKPATRRQAIFVTNFGILRTFKVVHQEAMGILYGQKLYFHARDSLQHFLLRLRPETISRLRYVDCGDRKDGHGWKHLPAVAALLRPATNLKSLRFEEIYKVRRTFDRHPCDDLSVFDWDIFIVRHVIKEVYRSLYPYLQVAVREMGPERVVSILHIFQDILEKGTFVF